MLMLLVSGYIVTAIVLLVHCVQLVPDNIVSRSVYDSTFLLLAHDVAAACAHGCGVGNHPTLAQDMYQNYQCGHTSSTMFL